MPPSMPRFNTTILAHRIYRALFYSTITAAGGASTLYFIYRPLNIPGTDPAMVPPPVIGLPTFPSVKSRAEMVTELKRSWPGNNTESSSSSYSHSTSNSSPSLWTRLIWWLGGGYAGGPIPIPDEFEPDSSDPDPNDVVYDLLVIGGGATGTGIALDAATRGLKVAMVERDDFSSGTSSKSTKLVHGGVRYLEKAVWEMDYSQYKLVKDALRERRYFLDTAPHLSQWLPIMIPLDSWWKAPYFWFGTKIYDFLAGSDNIESSYFLSKSKALEAFPTLKKEGLKGALVYYVNHWLDGAHNDSRMNVSLAMTAALYGTTVVNHMEVTALEKDASGHLIGAQLVNRLPELNGQKSKPFSVRAKGIINATGPFTDSIRKLDDPSCKEIVAPSLGVHVILPGYFSPANMGLIDPSTSDGRVIFFLPWQGNTIAGTTDTPTDIESNPVAGEMEIDWILAEIRGYLQQDINVRRGDVLAAWSGIRPLVRDPKAKRTEGLVRNHLITHSDSGLITVAGGKWTTYREMAEESVDAAIKAFGLTPKPLLAPPRVSGTAIADDAPYDGSCQTHRVRLIGAHGYSKTLFINLIQHFGIETEVAKYLTTAYGDRAWLVAALCGPTNLRFPVRGVRISQLYPFVDGEVRYAVRHEYAVTAVDVLARRTRLAFLNAQAALEALPEVVDIMSEELGWDSRRRDKEWKDTLKFLISMGLPESKAKLSRLEVESGLVGQYPDEEYGLYARHDKPDDVLESDRRLQAATMIAKAN